MPSSATEKIDIIKIKLEQSQYVQVNCIYWLFACQISYKFLVIYCYAGIKIKIHIIISLGYNRQQMNKAGIWYVILQITALFIDIVYIK